MPSWKQAISTTLALYYENNTGHTSTTPTTPSTKHGHSTRLNLSSLNYEQWPPNACERPTDHQPTPMIFWKTTSKDHGQPPFQIMHYTTSTITSQLLRHQRQAQRELMHLKEITPPTITTATLLQHQCQHTTSQLTTALPSNEPNNRYHQSNNKTTLSMLEVCNCHT